MEIFEAISQRTSLKTKLSKRDVEREKIVRVLSAAALAPSARNNQPWRFIVLTDREEIDNLVLKAFKEGNQVVREGSVLILVFAEPESSSLAGGKTYYLVDVGMATQNLLLAATALGLATHPVIGVEEDELKKMLGVPKEYRFVIATPLAYPAEGSYEKAAEERLSERTRKEIKEIAYSGAWGKPF